MSTHPQNEEHLKQLSDYLDGTLDDAQCSAFEELLARDAGLRAELANWQAVDRLVHDTAGPAPELDWADFTAEARRRRRRADSPAHRATPGWSRLLRPLAAAAGLIIVVTAGLIWRMEPSADTGGDVEQTTAVAQIERAWPAAAATSTPFVQVSRVMPVAAVATVGPPPPARMLIVTVAAKPTHAVADLEFEEDAEYF